MLPFCERWFCEDTLAKKETTQFTGHQPVVLNGGEIALGIRENQMTLLTFSIYL